MAHEPAQGGKRLAGSLTLIDAIAQSVGFMGPVFSIAFLVPLLVGLNAAGKGAGTAAPLSVIIAAVGVLGLGWIIAQYARRIHAAGSLYNYVTDGLGERAGIACGILYYIGILALAVAILVMIGGTIHDTLAAEFSFTGIPEIGWDLILVVLLAVVLYAGVALSTRLQLTLALVSIVAVLAFFINVIARAKGGSASSAFSPSGSATGWSGIMFGVLYGVLLFTGFETAANLGEETAHPKRDIPRAILIAVLAVAGFYVIASYGQVAGYHFSLDSIAKNAGAPLFGLAGPTSTGGFGSVAIRRLLELVVVFDMIAVMIGASVSAARGLFALGRDGHLPRALGRPSAKDTPLVASSVVVAVDIVVIAVTVWWKGFLAIPETPHYAAIFSWLAAFGGFSLAVIYLLMSVGALRGLRDHPRQWAVWLAAIVGIAVTAGAIFGSIYKVTAPSIYAPYAAAAIFVIGLVIAFARAGRGGAPAAAADSVTTAEAGRSPGRAPAGRAARRRQGPAHRWTATGRAGQYQSKRSLISAARPRDRRAEGPAMTTSTLYYDHYDVAIYADPYPVYRRLREEAPLYYNDQHGYYALSRFADVERALTDPGTFISGRGAIVELIKSGLPIPPGVFIFEDPPVHTMHRRLLSGVFTPRKVAALEPAIREFTAGSLDPFAAADEFDFVADLGAQMPMRVIGMLLGIPEGDQEAIRTHIDDSLRTEAGKPMRSKGAVPSGEIFADYIEWRAAHPSDDIMTDLLQAEFEDETGARRRLTRDEILTYVTVIAGAGNETTNRLIGWTGKVLSDHPDQRRELAASPGLIPSAIEELLRYEPPAHHQARYVARDAELQGQLVPEGSIVLLLTGSGNRDDRQYPDGDRFDIHREASATLSFGRGIHFCLGAALARLEGRIALEEILRRFPDWEVDTARATLASTSTVRGWESLPARLG